MRIIKRVCIVFFLLPLLFFIIGINWLIYGKNSKNYNPIVDKFLNDLE